MLWIHTAAADSNNINIITNCSIKYVRIHRNQRRGKPREGTALGTFSQDDAWEVAV